MFRWVDHTAELELEIGASGEEEVFAEAARALGELLGGDAEAPPVRRRVAAQASDRPALLATWLEELVFLAESEGFEPEGIEAIRLSPDAVETTVVGRLGEPPPLVKGITYHRLAFSRLNEGYRATVVFDV